MKSIHTIFLVLLTSSVGFAEIPDFTKDVAPILNKYCVGCHSSDEPEADLRLDTFEHLLHGGENGQTIDRENSSQSLLISRLTATDDLIMPPTDEPRPSEKQIALLVEWVNNGSMGPSGQTNESHFDATPARIEFDRIEPADGPKPVTAVAYRPGGGIAIAGFGSIRFFTEPDQATTLQLDTLGKVHAVRFTKDGKQMVAASGIAGLKGEAIIWEVNDGSVAQRFQGHNDAIYAVAISKDSSLLATGSYDRQIIVWDIETGKRLRTLRGHNGAIFDLRFSPDANVLVSASADATVKVWNVNTGQRLDTLGQPLKEQYSVDISPDGKFIIAGGEDNRIRMWQLVANDIPRINPIMHARFAHEGPIEQVRFSSDGNYIVSSSSDKTLKVWSSDEIELLHSYPLGDMSTETFAISTDSQRIGVGQLDGEVKTYPLRTNARSMSRDVGEQRVFDRIIRNEPLNEFSETEPNDMPSSAMKIDVPAKISGKIRSATTDQDFFRFAARAGEEWIVEVKAARNKSPLDSHIAILHEDGTPVPRVKLQAVRDSYFTFRGKDSTSTGDFRMHNWEEMRLNQYLYSAGEVVKLYHYPRGPDSGFNVYPNFGSRRGYFDTTPIAHALHEPAYIVEPHPPEAILPPNGLPVFIVNYENDDDSQRRIGKDSRLTFSAPKNGNYLVVVRDVRGMQGSDFEYELLVRPPQPDFACTVLNMNPKVTAGSGKKIGFEAQRSDGYDGPIDVRVSDLPTGLSISGPLQIEAGHDRVWATLQADDDAKTPSEELASQVKVIASATIAGEAVERIVGSIGKIEVAESSKILVDLIPDHVAADRNLGLPVIELQAGGTTTATIRITRVDHDGRVGFGKEDGAVNAPHGVYVDNSGLNGVLIVEGQDERQFFITAEPWVQPMERVIFVESDVAGNPTSNPVTLRILAADQPKSTDQVSR